IMSCVTSTGSLQSPKASVILDLSFSMSSKRMSSTMGSSRGESPGRAAGALHLYRVRLARRKRRALALGHRLRYRDGVAGGGAPLPRGRALEVVLALPNLLRLFWRLLLDPRVPLWPPAVR